MHVLRAAACVLVVASPLAAQAIDTSLAFGALRDARAACTADAGALWGRSLCGPVALVERGTKLVVANDTIDKRAFLRAGDAIISTAPSGGFANTSVDWNGRRWATILLPLPPDRFDRTSLVLHESFHREQEQLHLVGSDPSNNQLDQLEGRRWFRLELRALAAALDAGDSSAALVRQHVTDALLFRAARHALYPAADSLEPALEMQEGLAEYTGEKLALALTGERMSRVSEKVRAFQSNPTFVRSFAYATGPALGMLLDRFNPDWRQQVSGVRDPARLLATALGFKVPRDVLAAARERGRSYGADVVAREEIARDSIRRPAIAEYTRRFIEGPTITLRQTGLARAFNPNNMIGFSVDATVYPTGNFAAEWGSLEVSNGALVDNDFSRLRIDVPQGSWDASAHTIAGNGWTLKLNPGWALQPDRETSGSFVAVKLVKGGGS